MLAASFLMFALAATGFAQVPTGYRTVYITSNVNTKFVIVPKSPTNGSTIVVQTLTSKPEQQWYIKDGNTTGKVQLANSTLCLDGGAKSNWKDMSNIYVKDCSDSDDSQKWVVMTDGRITLAASSPPECVDLQYMRATANNPVGLYSCAGLGNAGAGDKGINWPLANVTS
ncbi:carbohydrate-binding module family 13 protein [Glonium stellatum]|uniref:Carbohydrate-binding module family 13 protein n=1 Tax=Glonium stellatum TaxID=574774 RepID=A0A8E2F5U4_9PEZI|nr:carbohydrate-binding module family 13 protein [Glonium stellatum]